MAYGRAEIMGGRKRMNTIEKQQEKITNLLKLISENPDLEILPMVDSEIGNEDYSRTLGEWGTAEVDYYYCSDERIYFKSDDFDELVEGYIDNNFEVEHVSDEIVETAQNTVNSYEWTKAIIVNINSN